MHLHISPVLSKEARDAIHTATETLLETVGVRLAYAPARAALAKYGCRVVGERVYIPWRRVEAALATAPRSFPLIARRAEHSVRIGGGGPVFAMAYGSAFVTDRLSGRRLGNLQDYRDLQRLTQALRHVQVASYLPCDPQELDRATRHLDLFLYELQLTDKPLMGAPENGEAARDCLRMAGMVFGRDALERAPHCITLLNVSRPLYWEAGALEALMAYAEAGQPTILASYTMGGSSAPVTLAGLLVQTNAEILAGVVLSQAVREGAPVVYGTSSAPLDLGTANLALGSPETALLMAGQAELARSYGLPSRGGGALTDAKVLDAQAGWEAMLLTLYPVLAGTDFVLQAAGILESYQTVSYEKAVVDDEILGVVRRLLKGVGVDEGRLALDVIRQVADHGNYLETDHTFAYFPEEMRQTVLADRTAYSEWRQLGGRDVLQRATERWQELLASGEAEATPLGGSLLRDLEAFVDARKGERCTRTSTP